MAWTKTGRLVDDPQPPPIITLCGWDGDFMYQWHPYGPQGTYIRVRDGLVTAHMEFPPFTGSFNTLPASGLTVYLVLPSAYKPKAGVGNKICGEAHSTSLNQNSSFAMESVNLSSSFASFNFLSMKSGTVNVLTTSNYGYLLRQFFGTWGPVDISLEYEI
jgi:hypothetical protein